MFIAAKLKAEHSYNAEFLVLFVSLFDALFGFTFVHTASKLKLQIFWMTSSSHWRHLCAWLLISLSSKKVICAIRFWLCGTQVFSSYSCYVLAIFFQIAMPWLIVFCLLCPQSEGMWLTASDIIWILVVNLLSNEFVAIILALWPFLIAAQR